MRSPLWVCALLAIAAPADATDRRTALFDVTPPCVDYGAHMRSVFDLDMSAVRAIAPDGDVLYLAFNTELQAWDASDPSDPRAVGSVRFPGAPSRVVVDGHRAFVCRGGATSGAMGLVIIDVSDPTAMTVLGGLEHGPRAYDVAVQGDLAFLATETGATVLDVSAATPVILSRIPVDVAAHGVAIVGDVMLLAAGDRGVRSYDVSAPATPILLGTWWPSVGARPEVVAIASGGTTDQVAVGTFLDRSFAGGDEWEVVRLDVSDPENVIATDRAPVYGIPERLAVSAGRLFVAYTTNHLFHDERSGLQVFEMTPTRRLAPFGTVGRDGARGDVAVIRGHAFVADSTGPYNGHLRTVAVSRPAPSRVDVSADGYPRAMALRGDRMFGLNTWPATMDVRDVTRPGMPVVATVPAIQGTGAFAFADGLVYVASAKANGSPGRLDAVDPGESGPRILGTFPLGDQPFDLEVRNGIAYVAEYREVYDSWPEGTFRVVDFRRPEAAAEIWSSGVPCRQVVLHGAYAYVRADAVAPSNLPTLQIYDVSEPVPVLIREVATVGWPADMLLAGNLLFLAHSGTVEILSVADGADPRRLAEVALPDAEDTAVVHDFAFVGRTLYVANGDAGLQVIDVSDPEAPAVVGGYHSGSQAYRVEAGENGVFVAVYGVDGTHAREAILRLPLHCEIAPPPPHEPRGDLLRPPLATGLSPASAAPELSVRIAPNPFVRDAVISFRLPREGRASVSVYDVAGRRVRELVDATLGAGTHTVVWDGAGATGSGIYFLRLETPAGVRSVKAVRAGASR